MDNKLEDQVLIMQPSNDKLASEFTDMKSDTKKIYYEFTKMRSDMNYIEAIINQMMSPKNNPLPENMDSPKAQYPTTAAPSNKKAPPLEGGNRTKTWVACGLSSMRSDQQMYMNS